MRGGFLFAFAGFFDIASSIYRKHWEVIELVDIKESCGVACVPPPAIGQLGPGSLDLRLGKVDLFTNRMGSDGLPELEEQDIGKGFVLEPDAFAYVTTAESLQIPASANVTGWLTNKSSQARKGLSVPSQFVSLSSGLLNPGFEGKIVLEIKNRDRHHPVKIFPGEEVYKIFYCQAATFGRYGPGSRYVGDDKTNHPQL